MDFERGSFVSRYRGRRVLLLSIYMGLLDAFSYPGRFCISSLLPAAPKNPRGVALLAVAVAGPGRAPERA